MGMSQRRSSLRKRTTVGKERKTVTVALPLFDDKASGEENLLRVLLDTGSDGDLFFPTKRLSALGAPVRCSKAESGEPEVPPFPYTGFEPK